MTVGDLIYRDFKQYCKAKLEQGQRPFFLGGIAHQNARYVLSDTRLRQLYSGIFEQALADVEAVS